MTLRDVKIFVTHLVDMLLFCYCDIITLAKELILAHSSRVAQEAGVEQAGHTPEVREAFYSQGSPVTHLIQQGGSI